jgi:hypothetical protein
MAEWVQQCREDHAELGMARVNAVMRVLDVVGEEGTLPQSLYAKAIE